MKHLEHIEEIAIRVAEIYGQDYTALDAPAKQIYYETIKATPRNGGQSVFERACGQAIDEFYKPKAEAAEEAEIAPEPAPKSRKKR